MTSKIELPTPQELSDQLEEVNLDKVVHPRRLSELMENNFSIEPSGDDTIVNWIEDSEKWRDVPQKAARIDYWNVPKAIVDTLEEVRYAEDLDQPGLKGANLASNAILAVERNPYDATGYIVSVEPGIDTTDDNLNINQVAGPTQLDQVATLPDQYKEDDRFAYIEDDEPWLGVITDEETVLAEQVRDTIDYLETRSGPEFSSFFKKGYDETIENYTTISI